MNTKSPPGRSRAGEVTTGIGTERGGQPVVPSGPNVGGPFTRRTIASNTRSLIHIATVPIKKAMA